VTEGRIYPTRPFLAVSVAVFRDGKILLAARGKPPMDGLFSLPGGMVEKGETLGRAALRELREEVSVEAELVGFVAPVEVIERDMEGRVSHHVVIMVHAARWVSGEPQTGPEAREIRWVTEQDMAGLPTTPGLAGIVSKSFVVARSVGLA
jgi:8-oxo-dGTP diphosphatase